jgi:hypothetical protein
MRNDYRQRHSVVAESAPNPIITPMSSHIERARLLILKKALKEIKPSTRAWFEVARNYAMFANDGGTYDELLDHLRANKLI